VGLAIGLLYSGYEQCSTVAKRSKILGERFRSRWRWSCRCHCGVFLPTFASLAALGNWRDWHTGYFSDAAQRIALRGSACG